MSRAAAIARAHSYFDSGEFLVDLRRRVAIPSTSQEPERAAALRELSRRRDGAEPRPARIYVAHSRQSVGPAVPGGGAHRGCGPAHGPDLRPRRHGARSRRPVAAGPFALGADRRRPAHLWPRHGRQQGPAQHQHRGAGGGAGRARRRRRAPGLQHQDPDRDGRGGRLGRAARALHAAQARPAAGGLADRLGRPAHRARSADDLSRCARRLPDRPHRRSARGRPSFRQLGRPPRQSRDHPGACARLHHRCTRHDPGAGMAAAAAAIGAHAAGRRGSRRRRQRPDRRPRLGRTGAHAGRARVRLEQFRGAGIHDRHAGPSGQRHSGQRARPLPVALRGRNRRRRHRSGAAPSPRPPSASRRCEVRGGDDGFFRASRLDPEDPWVGFTAAIDRAHHRQGADHPAQSRRLAAQRQLHRRAGPAHDLDPAFLCRVLAARAR